MIRTELLLLLSALACGPKGPPPPPPTPARFCADGLPLHTVLAMGALHAREDLVVAGPNPPVPLAGDTLEGAVAAALAQAEVSALQLPGGPRLVGPAPARPEAVDLGERRANLELVQVSLVELAQLLSSFSGRDISVEGGDTPVTLVLQGATAGEALAAVVATAGLSVSVEGATVRLTVPPGAPPVAPGTWGEAWRYVAWTGGDRPEAWLVGPGGFPVAVREKGRARIPAGDLTALSPEAATFSRWDRDPTPVPLCGVVPRGEGLWTARGTPERTESFKRLTPEDHLWSVLYGPLDGRQPREVALLFASGGPRAEARARILEDETTGTPLPWAVERIAGVFIGDADGDGGEELLVVGDWITGVGPEGVVPFPATLVVDVGRDRLTVEARDDLASTRTAEALSAALGVAVAAAPGSPGPRAVPPTD